MRIIVTGSRGLIGSTVTAYLKTIHEVIEYDLTLGHDLSNEMRVKRLFEAKADALVNLFAINDHVGIDRDKTGIFDVPLSSLDDYFRTNLTVLFSVCREFSRNNARGSIVNFSSTYGITAPRHEKHIGYTVSKAGVIMLTKHLAVALAPNIRVNCIAPGGVLHQQGDEFIKYYGGRTPMGRMMEAQELNGIVEYLCSYNSSYVTGSVFSVDGGWTC